MARRIRLATEASLEFKEALLWYDSQEVGLGDSFLQKCDEVFLIIADDPERHPEIGRGYRRYVIQEFPFAILYEFDDREVIIVSVFNCSRDPQIWKDRLGIQTDGD